MNINDCAETLLALFGADAAAAADAFAADCERAGWTSEAVYWRRVSETLSQTQNPQPLIAADTRQRARLVR